MPREMTDAEYFAYDHKRNCPCGSGNPKHALNDARGYFCAYICDECEADKRAEFRPEIFTDSQYEADDLGYEEEL